MAGKLDKEIEDKLEMMRKEQEIICPYCSHQQSQEDKYQHVTYWAEDPPKKTQCGACGKEFFVKEKVRRTFECFKESDEEDDNIFT